MKNINYLRIRLLSLTVFALFVRCIFTTSVWGGKKMIEPSNNVKIDFWMQDWSGGNLWMKAYISEFQKRHPKITVNHIPVPFDQLYTKLIPSIMVKNEPPVMFGYDEWLLGKDPSKLFLGITPTIYTKKEFENYIQRPPLKNITGSDGNYYGVPMLTGANAFGFVYHKDLFREANIDASKIKTFDDLKAAAKKLRKRDSNGNITRSGILFSYTETANAFLDLIQHQGGSKEMLNPNTNTWNLNTKKARNSLNSFKWFVDNKIYDPQSGDPFKTFPNKQGAMLLIGPWDVGVAMSSFPDLEVSYFTMPKYDTNSERVFGSVLSYGSYFISKNIDKDEKKAAIILIRDMIENNSFIDTPLYASPPYWVGAVANKNYLEDLKNRSDSEMNEFSKTALEVSMNGLPNVKTLETLISEPILIRQQIYPMMHKVFMNEISINDALNELTEQLTMLEKEKGE